MGKKNTNPCTLPMSEQFFHGLRLLLSTPIPALAAHGAMLWYARRKAARQTADLPKAEKKRRIHELLRYLLPKQRVWAVYAASLAATALVAALDVNYFSLRLLFGLVFFCAALMALRWEHKAKERQKLLEAEL